VSCVIIARVLIAYRLLALRFGPRLPALAENGTVTTCAYPGPQATHKMLHCIFKRYKRFLPLTQRSPEHSNFWNKQYSFFQDSQEVSLPAYQPRWQTAPNSIFSRYKSLPLIQKRKGKQDTKAQPFKSPLEKEERKKETRISMTNPNPIDLPPRFQVRKLDQSHADWTKAVLAHSNLYHSPVWSKIYPDNHDGAKPARLYKFYQALHELVTTTIAEGYSYGVFDTEYRFKNPDSAATGGRVYWDDSDFNSNSNSNTNINISGEELLSQIDTPLISVALAFDGASPRDNARIYGPILGRDVLPVFAHVFAALDRADTRPEDDETRKPRGLKEVLFRAGTATRADYLGLGIARALGWWLLRKARRDDLPGDRDGDEGMGNGGMGFKRGMQVGYGHAAVERIFLDPALRREGFVGVKVAGVDLGGVEVEVEDGDGEEKKKVVRRRPFEVCGDVPCGKIFVAFC